MMVSRLIRGDCLEVLTGFGSGWFDLTVTSPPYNKREKGGEIVAAVEYDSLSDNAPEAEYQRRQIAVLDECWRVTKEGGSMFYNHKVRVRDGRVLHPMGWLTETRWRVRQEIVWNRLITPSLAGVNFNHTDERIYWLYKPAVGGRLEPLQSTASAAHSTVWTGMPETGSPHPAPFPLWIPARLIIALLPPEPAGRILDPFCGSGTTCVAAALLGHDYVGIDLSGEYLNYAEQRIDRRLREIPAVERELDLAVKSTSKYRKQPGMNLVLPGVE